MRIFFHSVGRQTVKRTSRRSSWPKLRAWQKTPQEDPIERLAKKGIIARAGAQAIAEQHRLGLAVTIKEGNKILKLYPDGRREVIADNLPTPPPIHITTLQIPR